MFDSIPFTNLSGKFLKLWKYFFDEILITVFVTKLLTCLFIQPSKGLKPNIQGSKEDVSKVKKPAARGRYNKHEICFAKSTPMQQQRREHIDEIEFGLTQHPLALYPHLEECLPPDVSCTSAYA